MHIFKKIFVFSLLTAFVVMVVTQMLLKNSAIKNKLSRLYEIESQYVYSEKEIADGYIIVKVSNPSDKIFLMQNGEKIKCLNTQTSKIIISDNSVIEVYGVDLDAQCTLEIIEVSENIYGFYEKNITIKANIVILGRFFIK